MKLESLKKYKKRLEEKCIRKCGQDFVDDNEELIELAAMNKRMLDRFDDEISNDKLTTMSIGSTGQMKNDINPMVKHRNDTAKLYADNLDALMLTSRSRYKKTDANIDNREDKLATYLENLQ